MPLRWYKATFVFRRAASEEDQARAINEEIDNDGSNVVLVSGVDKHLR
jgi:hypothetical protein